MGFRDHINWSWNEFGNPAEVKCIAFIVDDSKIPPEIRGNISAHDCIVNAIREIRSGNHTKGERWLLASQCHDEEAQQEIHDAGFSALQYTMETYGPSVP